MDSLDFLDSLTVGQDAEESNDFVQHPCGAFSGIIEEVKTKTVNERPVWEIVVRTAKGRATHNRWGFSTGDMQEARTRQEARDRMIETIKRHKRLFVDCRVWNLVDAKAKKWNDILGGWEQLKGKDCQIVVKPNHKKPGYTITFINALSDTHVDQVDSVQPQAQPKAQPAASTGRRLPGESSSLDDIPY